MTNRTINRILIGMGVLGVLAVYALVSNQAYTEARIGANPCEVDVRSCE